MSFKIIFKRRLEDLVRIIQKVLITVFLFLIYFLGLGLTLIFIYLFSRKLIYSEARNRNSSWLETEGYVSDLEECFRQS
jgi:cytochrome c biogenesis protein CcdA